MSNQSILLFSNFYLLLFYYCHQSPLAHHWINGKSSTSTQRGMATGNGNWRDGVLLKIHPMSFCGRCSPEQALMRNNILNQSIGPLT